MSQLPQQVNVIDMATPSGTAAAGNVGSNLNQIADRKLRAAEIGIRAQLEQSRIKAEASLEKMKLDTEEHIAKMQTESTASEHAKYQNFQSQEADKDRAHQEKQQKLIFKRQDALLAQQKADDQAADQAQLDLLRGSIASEEDKGKKLDEIKAKQKNTAEELASLSLLSHTATEDNKVNFEGLERDLKTQAESDLMARNAGVDVGSSALMGVLRDAVANQPGIGGRFRSTLNKLDEGTGPENLLNPLVAGAITVGDSILNSVSNYVGEDMTQVQKGPLTDPESLVVGALAKMVDQDMMGTFKGNPGEARNAMINMGVQVMRSLNEPGMENDKAAKNAIAVAKSLVPAATLDSAMETFGKLRSDPALQEAVEKAGGSKESTNWKKAHEATLKGAGDFYKNFKRLTSTATDGSGAYIQREPLDFEKVQSVFAGGVALAAKSPDETLRKLMNMGMTPKTAEKTLTRAKALVKDPRTQEELQKAIDAAKLVIRTLEGDADTLHSDRDLDAMKSTASALQGKIKARSNIYAGVR